MILDDQNTKPTAPENNEQPGFRFDIAFSFAGPHRDKVRTIARLVAKRCGKEKVFFDEWYEHEILGADMDVFLQRVYHDHSLLIVADVSNEYSERDWTNAEARAIRALRFGINPSRDENGRLRLLDVRFGKGEVPGVFETGGCFDCTKKGVEQCAELILKRFDLLVQRMVEKTVKPRAIPIRASSSRDPLREDLEKVLKTKYQIINRIACGHRTKVYLAQDILLDRRVAIKVVADRKFNQEFVDALKESVKVIEYVPHCIPIFGAWTKREPYHVVMNHMKGGTLREKIDNAEGFSMKEVHRILSNIGDSLISAHSAGFTHCNIKPSNILMGSRKDCYLSPMGRTQKIVKASLLEALVRRSLKKDDETFREDLSYLAPEIFEKSRPSDCPEEIRKKIDQFMLGLLGYELLTGRTPNTVDARVLKDNGSVVYLPLDSVANIRRDCPSRLSRIIATMVSYQPQNRFNDLKTALDELAGVSFDAFEIAKDSYSRCLANSSGHDFMKAFYSEFLRISDEARVNFAGFDDSKFAKHYSILKEAIFILLIFGESRWRDTEPNVLSRIAARHGAGAGGMRISGRCYNEFVLALTNVICGSASVPEAHDPGCRNSENDKETIRHAWEEALRPGIQYMKDN